MDYNTLIANKQTANSLAARINYALLPAADLIYDAQCEIFTRLRVREMRTSFSAAVAVGASSSPLPDGYLDALDLRGPYGCPLKRVSDERLLDMRCYDATGALISGVPSRYGISDGAFQFDFMASSAFTLNGLCYTAPYINADSQTSFLTTRYSDLFWAVLLKAAYAYAKDFDAAAKHAADAESKYQLVSINDDLSYTGLDDADSGWRL